MVTGCSIFDSAEEESPAYGIFITIDDSTMKMFDQLRQCKARKKVDVSVRYNGITKEFTLTEFLQYLGFEVDELE